MEEYRPNSNKSKAEMPVKVAEKVTTGEVTVKKKSSFSKFVGEIIQEDTQTVKNYIFMDVLLPSLKKAISDIVRNGVDMMLYGRTGVSKPGTRDIGDRVSYRQYYEGNRANVPERRGTVYDYEELIFNNRGDADVVLERMFEDMEAYGIVAVGNMLEYAGLPTRSTDFDYGWMDLRTAYVQSVYNGYVIKLPRVLPISQRRN